LMYNSGINERLPIVKRAVLNVKGPRYSIPAL